MSTCSLLTIRQVGKVERGFRSKRLIWSPTHLSDGKWSNDRLLFAVGRQLGGRGLQTNGLRNGERRGVAGSKENLEINSRVYDVSCRALRLQSPGRRKKIKKWGEGLWRLHLLGTVAEPLTAPVFCLLRFCWVSLPSHKKGKWISVTMASPECDNKKIFITVLF